MYLDFFVNKTVDKTAAYDFSRTTYHSFLQFVIVIVIFRCNSVANRKLASTVSIMSRYSRRIIREKFGFSRSTKTDQTLRLFVSVSVSV